MQWCGSFATAMAMCRASSRVYNLEADVAQTHVNPCNWGRRLYRQSHGQSYSTLSTVDRASPNVPFVTQFEYK